MAHTKQTSGDDGVEPVYKITQSKLAEIINKAVAAQLATVAQNLGEQICQNLTASLDIGTTVQESTETESDDESFVIATSLEAPQLPKQISSMKVGELKKFIETHQISLPSTGSGANGSFKKSDYAQALENAGITTSSAKKAPPAKKTSTQKKAPPAKKGVSQKAPPATQKKAPPAKKGVSQKAPPATQKKAPPAKKGVSQKAPTELKITLSDEGYWNDESGFIYEDKFKSVIGKADCDGVPRPLLVSEARELVTNGVKMWHTHKGRPINKPATLDEINTILQTNDGDVSGDVSDDDDEIDLSDDDDEIDLSDDEVTKSEFALYVNSQAQKSGKNPDSKLSEELISKIVQSYKTLCAKYPDVTTRAAQNARKFGWSYTAGAP